MTLKRILCTLAALVMIALGAAATMVLVRHDPQARGYSNSDTNKTMSISGAVVDLRVHNDGSLTVQEQLAYDLGSVNWHGLYQDVILANNERVRSVRVYRLDNGVERLAPGSGIELGVGGAYGTYGYGVIKDPDRRLRIVWNVNDSGRHVFGIRYTLDGAVKNYADASTLLWDVWGTGWETGVGKLTAIVNFPGRMLFFAPRAGDLQRRVGEVRMRGRGATFTVTNLPARRQVQMRAAAKPLTGMRKQPTTILPKLRAEQAVIDARNTKQAVQSAEIKQKSYVWYLLHALAGSAVGLLLVLLAAFTIGRDPTKPIEAGGSYQYPPEKIPPPVIASALGGATVDNQVSSTILGLLQRDVFRVLPSVEKKEDISIRNLVGTDNFPREKVEDYEMPIAGLLQTAIDAHPEHSPDFTKLKKNLSPKQAETQLASYRALIKQEYPKYNLHSTYRGRVRRWLIGLVSLAIYVLSMIAVLGENGGNSAVRFDSLEPFLYLLGFAPVLLWAAVEGNAFYRLKKDQAERVRKWETYQDFFRQMDMSNQYPLTVEIWDEALLYAAAFGYAEKVITNMPRTAADGTPAPYSSDSNLGLVAFNAGSLSTFSNISSGISGMTGMSSSSSSGGGGFSGGGSGGGGGGGW